MSGIRVGFGGVLPVILSMLEHLQIKLQLGVDGVGGNPVQRLCSRHRYKLKEALVSDWAGYLCTIFISNWEKPTLYGIV